MDRIAPLELKRRLEEHPDLALLDVRTPGEFDALHIPGSRNEPLDALKPHALAESGWLAKDKPVYVICRMGPRAQKAADAFAREGFSNAVVLDGGTQAWLAAGLPVTLGKAKVISIERQVRIGAGSLVVTGVLLAHFVHPYCIGISAFVGTGLVFAGITDYCGMGLLLLKMPWNK